MNYTSRFLKDYIQLGTNPHPLFIVPVLLLQLGLLIHFRQHCMETQAL